MLPAREKPSALRSGGIERLKIGIAHGTPMSPARIISRSSSARPSAQQSSALVGPRRRSVVRKFRGGKARQHRDRADHAPARFNHVRRWNGRSPIISRAAAARNRCWAASRNKSAYSKFMSTCPVASARREPWAKRSEIPSLAGCADQLVGHRFRPAVSRTDERCASELDHNMVLRTHACRAR